MLCLVSPTQSVAASADFGQFSDILKRQTVGYLRDDGSFVFRYWSKNVLTNNAGVKIKTGYISKAEYDWRNPALWTSYYAYFVQGFSPIKAGTKSHVY